MRVLIGIPTYRRHDQLAVLLRSLVDQLPANWHILVVDNFGDAGGVVESARSECVRYQIEKVPGVVAVRNAILEHAHKGRYDGIVFVDDDMVVPSNWSAELLKAIADFPSSVLAGHVAYHCVAPVSDPFVRTWVSRRLPGEHGQILSTSGTGNVYVPLDLWRRAGSPTFDMRFAQVGGEDAAFFEGLMARGVVLRRVPAVLVQEGVAPDRCNRRWIRRRLMREGQARAIMAGGGRVSVVTRGSFKAGVGLVQLIWARVFRRVDYRHEARLWNGVGAIAMCFQGVKAEYGRSSNAE